MLTKITIEVTIESVPVCVISYQNKHIMLLVNARFIKSQTRIANTFSEISQSIYK